MASKSRFLGRLTPKLSSNPSRCLDDHHATRILNNPRTTLSFFLVRTTTMASSSSSWSCKKCTFLNSPSQKSHCEMCLKPVSSSSSSSSPSSSSRWPCNCCTFLNPFKNSACEICGGTRGLVASLSRFEDLTDTGLDGELDCSVGSVFFPLRRCKRKSSDDSVVVVVDGDGEGDCSDSLGFREIKALNKEIATNEVDDSKAISLKILSYNVWFREDLELHKRMKAIGDLIQLHAPDLICFQEVTPNIYDIFRQSNWWKTYRCSVSNEAADSGAYFCMQLSKLPAKSFSCKPFRNSIMGRELCIAEVEIAGYPPLVLATSHLESPCPGPPKWDQMFSKERIDQAKEALKILEKNQNVIFGGDMNWDDKLDGKFPLPGGWFDAWTELKPGENGFTYDTKSNPMLSGNRTLQKRLDRFVCCLKDYKITGIEMIGKDAIIGLSYLKEKKARNQTTKMELPVLPSDHYGLLLTISSR